MRTFSGPANRYARSPGNQARQDDTYPKAGRREAQTFVTKREVRGAGEASAPLSVRLLYKRWRTHLSVSCDKRSGIPSSVLFLSLGLVIQMTQAWQKSLEQYGRSASLGESH